MSTEKEIFYDFINSLFQKLSIPYIHIKNSSFAGTRYRKPNPENVMMGDVNGHPDYTFCFNEKLYLREYGIEGKNLDQKGKQLERMRLWAKQGADIKLIFSEEAMMADFRYIGILK